VDLLIFFFFLAKRQLVRWKPR